MHKINISSSLISWYEVNKRSLPWRENSKPYYVWLSEIILQQTRVKQGLAYFYRFVQTFPTINDLASASEDEVLKTWQGLGYYSRARNLHYTAKDIVYNKNGVFPDTYEKLLLLRGVGDYTAAAIASIVYDEPVPVVDGNVFRVLTRLYGIATPINKAETKTTVKQMATELLGHNNPGLFNQAIMEFGALQCIPSSPDCAHCPLHITCYAFQNNMVHELPVKLPVKKQRKRYFYYLVHKTSRDTTYMKKRKSGDIWTGLWEFPVLEKEKKTSWSEILTELADKGGGSTQINVGNKENTYKHVLSHQIIYASFIILYGNIGLVFDGCTEIQTNELLNYPVSRLTERFLDDSRLI